MGFHERYVVENKDRYLAERYYLDEWDKGLRARGLVKQQREQYRQRPDYHERLGAFEWELPEETHSDFFVGDMTKWWLETKPQPEGPLFLQIGFPGPHPPYDPIPRYAEPYMARDLPLPSFTEEELAGQPPPFLAMRQHNAEVDHDSIAYSLNPTPEQLHRQRAYYLANVTMIDEKIGEILDTLDARGYLENSVVILTSDHGDQTTNGMRAMISSPILSAAHPRTPTTTSGRLRLTCLSRPRWDRKRFSACSLTLQVLKSTTSAEPMSSTWLRPSASRMPETSSESSRFIWQPNVRM